MALPTLVAMADDLVRLDNRGLTPPEPMVRTLAAYDRLAPGARLLIHNDRVPVYLLVELAELRAEVSVTEHDDGSAEVEIRKPVQGAT
jgi:TusA-related sulfurtransferase